MWNKSNPLEIEKLKNPFKININKNSSKMVKYIFILFLSWFEKKKQTKNERLCDFTCLEEEWKNKVFVDNISVSYPMNYLYFIDKRKYQRN